MTGLPLADLHNDNVMYSFCIFYMDFMTFIRPHIVKEKHFTKTFLFNIQQCIESATAESVVSVHLRS